MKNCETKFHLKNVVPPRCCILVKASKEQHASCWKNINILQERYCDKVLGKIIFSRFSTCKP